jgi:hypothetical protein
VRTSASTILNRSGRSNILSIAASTSTVKRLQGGGGALRRKRQLHDIQSARPDENHTSSADETSDLGDDLFPWNWLNLTGTKLISAAKRLVGPQSLDLIGLAEL